MSLGEDSSATLVLPQRRPRGQRRLAWALPVAMIMPSFLLAVSIIAYPLVQLSELATHQVNRFGQLRGFVGMENFAHVLGDPLFASSAWRTLLWTAGIVVGTIGLSGPVALILNRDFHGRGVARVIIMRVVVSRMTRCGSDPFAQAASIASSSQTTVDVSACSRDTSMRSARMSLAFASFAVK